VGAVLLLITPFIPMVGDGKDFVRLTAFTGPFYICVGAALVSLASLLSGRLQPLIAVSLLTLAGMLYVKWAVISALNQVGAQRTWGALTFSLGAGLVFVAGAAAQWRSSERRRSA
jgi:hypothetical protein